LDIFWLFKFIDVETDVRKGRFLFKINVRNDLLQFELESS